MTILDVRRRYETVVRSVLKESFGADPDHDVAFACSLDDLELECDCCGTVAMRPIMRVYLSFVNDEHIAQEHVLNLPPTLPARHIRDEVRGVIQGYRVDSLEQSLHAQAHALAGEDSQGS